MDHVLRSQITGRLGCYSDGEMYIVPITYVYDQGYIYAHSKVGLKIQMMRKNPKVCFEVDAMENMANWRSVILWGEYEELKTDKEQRAGMNILIDRLIPFTTGETVKPSSSFSKSERFAQKALRPVAYRIKVLKKTGRYEKSGSNKIH